MTRSASEFAQFIQSRLEAAKEAYNSPDLSVQVGALDKFIRYQEAQRAYEEFVNTEVKHTCAFEGCTKDASVFACGRDLGFEHITTHPNPAHYCDEHADIVTDEGDPEYLAHCPACQCQFGNN